MSPNSVGAVCIHVTVVVAGDTFIDIYISTIKTELLNFWCKVDENVVILEEKSRSLLLF